MTGGLVSLGPSRRRGLESVVAVLLGVSARFRRGLRLIVLRGRLLIAEGRLPLKLIGTRSGIGGRDPALGQQRRAFKPRVGGKRNPVGLDGRA